MVCAGGVGAARERLHLLLVLEAARLVLGRCEFVDEQVFGPPRDPAAEVEVVPPRRGVGRLARRDLPSDGSVAERATGVVVGLRRRGDRLAPPVGTGTGRRRDLEVRAAVLGDGQLVPRSPGLVLVEADPAGTGAGPGRDVDLQREAAGGADLRRALGHLDAVAVVGDVADLVPVPCLELTVGRQPANPALDPDRLARPVRAAVVDDVPQRARGLRRADPIAGQHGDVVVTRRRHRVPVVARPTGQGEHGEPVGVGRDRVSGGRVADGDTVERRAGRQVGDPHVLARGVGDDVDPEIGPLHPGHGGQVAPVVLVALVELADRRDAHDHLPVTSGHEVSEVDRRLDGHIGVAADLDRLFAQHWPVGLDDVPALT